MVTTQSKLIDLLHAANYDSSNLIELDKYFKTQLKEAKNYDVLTELAYVVVTGADNTQ